MLCSLTAAFATPVSAAHTVFAATPGACTVAGSETFSPALAAVPTDETVSITLSGATCETLAGADQVSITLSGTFLMACASGTGSVSGQVLFASNPPAGGAVSAVDVSTPASMLLAVTGSLDGVISLAATGWPLNTTSASLTGTFVFDSA